MSPRRRTVRLHGQQARNWLAARTAENEELKKMAGAARKTKLSKYEVTIKRQIEHVAVIEVEARSAEEAEDMAKNEADEPRSGHWREGDVISENIKAKLIRG